MHPPEQEGDHGARHRNRERVDVNGELLETIGFAIDLLGVAVIDFGVVLAGGYFGLSLARRHPSQPGPRTYGVTELRRAASGGDIQPGTKATNATSVTKVTPDHRLVSALAF